MRSMPCRSQSIGNPSSPRGFTLIELLVVITIIAVLVGLLTAAAQATRQRMRELQIRNDISQLSTSVQSWKTKHEMPYLPSRIVLREDGMYGTHATSAVATLEAQSIPVLKRIFPRLDTPQLAAARGNNPPFLGHDWNQDGVITAGDNGAFVLEGDQCLVFFLGGAQVNGATVGFSTNKAYPMSATGQREPPVFEFPTSRLQFVAHPQSATSPLFPNGAPFLSFMDANRDRPYLYFSARQGNDYTSDCPSSQQWTGVGTPVIPYSEATVARFINRDGFQIICAGADRTFGTGGTWDAATGAPYVNNTNSPGRDDFANFHPLRLGAGQ